MSAALDWVQQVAEERVALITTAFIKTEICIKQKNGELRFKRKPTLADALPDPVQVDKCRSEVSKFILGKLEHFAMLNFDTVCFLPNVVIHNAAEHIALMLDNNDEKGKRFLSIMAEIVEQSVPALSIQVGASRWSSFLFTNERAVCCASPVVELLLDSAPEASTDCILYWTRACVDAICHVKFDTSCDLDDRSATYLFELGMMAFCYVQHPSEYRQFRNAVSALRIW
jgi:hypothetical protein